MALLSDIDTGRGTGRTQFMIDQLCDAVAEGQPRSLVVVHNRAFANLMIGRIMDDLKHRGLRPYVDINRTRILAEGSEIRVILAHCPHQYLGLSGYGKFFDHFIDQTDPLTCDEIDASVR